MKKKKAYPKISELLLSLNSICEYICRHILQDPEALLGYVLKKIVLLMHAKAGNIRLFDESTKTLILKASYGVSKKYRKMKLALEVGTSVAGYVFENGKVYVSENLKKNNLYRHPEYAIREGITSLISAPLTTSERKLGVLSIYFPKPRKFDQEEIEFFSILANFLAAFLTTHVLHYQLRRNYLDIAKALIVTLEEKDTYTKGHSERVREYAVKIAKKFRFHREAIRILSDFSILHDIGKVIVDSSILNKKETLSEEEWRIIKQHPVVGAKMIAPVDGLIYAIPLVKHHHERIDGKGYPDGLAGSKIPLMARIIAVADAFDAMTSPRAYRKALTLEQVRNQLIKNAGKQFDEKIVKVMIDLIETGEVVPK